MLWKTNANIINMKMHEALKFPETVTIAQKLEILDEAPEETNKYI